jgi:hypothetical protein
VLLVTTLVAAAHCRIDSGIPTGQAFPNACMAVSIGRSDHEGIHHPSCPIRMSSRVSNGWNTITRPRSRINPICLPMERRCGMNAPVSRENRPFVSSQSRSLSFPSCRTNTVHPGDLLYFPDEYWHATINLDRYTAFVSTFTTEHEEALWLTTDEL